MLLFHGTSRNFDSFDSARMLNVVDRHPNCELGLWLTTSPHLASRFGEWALAVEAPSVNPYRMPISDLSRLSGQSSMDADGGIERHREIALALRKQGYDIILVEEVDGSHPTVVSLYPDQCEIVLRVESTALGVGELVRLDDAAREAEGREMTAIERSFLPGM